MKISKVLLLLSAGLAVAGLAVGVTAASAQDKFPSKPIKVEVPFGAGSATDIVIRIVGDEMRHELGQQIVVENKPGAFGILAIEEMVRARPDGYTLQVGNPGTNALAPIIYKDKFKIDYDNEVAMVTRLGEVPLILAATTKDFAPKTYAEFIALAKANPGKVRYASVGVGSNNHYDTEAFAQWAGIKMIHIPNKGGGAAITNDLVSGDAQVAFVNAASSAGVIKGGLLKVLAVMADERQPEYPDVPTLKELGYANGKGLWSALYASSKTPPDVLETIHKATVTALKSAPVKEAFQKQMIKAVPDASIAAAKAWDEAERAYWKKLTETVKVEKPE
jgi:tripartite-type tricarboxylate transporter receptor subunit TctC